MNILMTGTRLKGLRIRSLVLRNFIVSLPGRNPSVTMSASETHTAGTDRKRCRKSTCFQHSERFKEGELADRKSDGGCLLFDFSPGSQPCVNLEVVLFFHRFNVNKIYCVLEQLSSSRVNLGLTRKAKIFISQKLTITQIFCDTVYRVQIEKTEKIHLCHLTDVLNRVSSRRDNCVSEK